MNHGLFTVPRPQNEPVLTYSPGSPEKLAVKAEIERQKSQTIAIPLVIGGRRVDSDSKIDVRAPHNREMVLARAATATKAQVNQAISAALEARSSWAALAWEDRVAVFLRAADLITERYRAKMNVATMLGQSKTIHQAEIEAACELADFLRFNAYFARQLYEEQPMHSPRGQWNRLSARPLEGFVAAIAPFNFTAISINLAACPAMMGCTVVWKPSPTAALSSYYGMQILEEAGLPGGVINMIQGEPQMIGETLLTHPDLAGVHFTGSTKTFQHIQKTVGQNIAKYKSYPRVVGETGGKDFVFAHESAEPRPLTIALVRGAFEYQGQKCSAASRAYIPKSLWNTCREDLINTVKTIRMGDPEDFSNFMAAVIDERAFDKITGYIELVKKSDKAKIICGGGYDKSRGFFVEPTVIETSDPHFVTMHEEIFGPILTVFPYEDSRFEETLAICSQTSPYALTGAIFAQDRLMIDKMARSLENAAGNFYINDKPTGAVVGQQPFGGARASGTNDKAGSIFNLIRWVSHRTIKENFIPVTEYSYPFMQEP